MQKPTIIGIESTLFGNVVPNAVTRLRGYFRNMKMEGRGRYLYNNIFSLVSTKK